jgi:hypothetical protein
MPTAMAIQFINTLNANRFLLAIGVPVRKLHDTTAYLPQFSCISYIRYLLCAYHFGTKNIAFSVTYHEISSRDAESLVELAQRVSAHDSSPQDGLVTTATLANNVISSNRGAA